MHLIVNIIISVAGLSCLIHLVIDVYTVADSSSVNNVQQKTLHH